MSGFLKYVSGKPRGRRDGDVGNMNVPTPVSPATSSLPGRRMEAAPANSQAKHRPLPTASLAADGLSSAPSQLLDLCGARGREQGLKVPGTGVKHALRVSWLQGPRPEGPAEWRFHRPLRGGNEFQAGFWCSLPPCLRPPALGGLGADSTGVWTVSAAPLSARRGGAGRWQRAGTGWRGESRLPQGSWGQAQLLGGAEGEGSLRERAAAPHPAQPSLGGGTKGS